jgi:predicted RNA-binding Zn ribbon-like protein
MRRFVSVGLLDQSKNLSRRWYAMQDCGTWYAMQDCGTHEKIRR